MRTQRASIRAIGVAAAGLASAVLAAPISPQRFVVGWPVEAPPNAEFFDVPLSAEVYAYGGAKQLAVLDANGEPQAFFVRALPAADATERRVTLEASPVYAERSGAAVASVTTNERRTAVTVTQGDATEPAVIGFVIDARDAAVRPIALELDWRALPMPFLLDVRVEQSSDLNDWRGVGAGSVAALSIADTEVRQSRVRVSAGAGGYYRITARGGVADWYLQRATLVSTVAEPAPVATVRLERLNAEAVAAAEAGALYFDAGGALPVSAMNLDFGAGNGWARVDVATASALEGPWRPVLYGQLFYSLEFEGQRLASDAFALGRHAARYWRLAPKVPLRTAPALRLTYGQETLRVAAAGAPPYLLAAGTLAAGAGPDPTFASVWVGVGRPDAVVPPATLGARRELGGPAALDAPREIPWRLVALWAVLGGGVLVVAYMAVRLAREMQAKSS
jgi:Protein of unknown function (DUF3999)